uniref:Uncharacterized protein n=2 Tax=Lotharella oceanica TaxID=641309 RepID=A0A7S2X935_9EUKA|mmetsp:Transcript_19397/g.36534  ORF Transcript_19397/g.36534 Transcript_19397/m.36534 type:complete len:257 (+) Transcript_19397:259-1029(+)
MGNAGASSDMIKLLLNTVGRGTSSLPPSFRPGDWMCPDCKAHNYADKTSCFKCNKSKPENAEKKSLEMAGGLPPNFRPGDWLCKKCNAHNYASKTACYKCGFVDPDKPTAPASENAPAAAEGAEGKGSEKEATGEETSGGSTEAAASGMGVPSVVICVDGLVVGKDLKNDMEYKELMDETTEEFSKYGYVEKVVIPRPAANEKEENGQGQGMVYVRFQKVEDATKAAEGVSSRVYDGRTIKATYITTEELDGVAAA